MACMEFKRSHNVFLDISYKSICALFTITIGVWVVVE